jgi:hypothetical protein
MLGRACKQLCKKLCPRSFSNYSVRNHAAKAKSSASQATAGGMFKIPLDPQTVAIQRANRIYQEFAIAFRRIHSIIKYSSTAAEQQLYLLFDKYPQLEFKLKGAILKHLIYDASLADMLSQSEIEKIKEFMTSHKLELAQIRQAYQRGFMGSCSGGELVVEA